MDQKHKTWAIRAGVGAGVCALLTIWMVPDTTPTAKPSAIAEMADTAEAQKPTYSAVPDSAIPSWAASLQQVPGASPSAPPPPLQVADAGPPPDADSTSAPPDANDVPVPDQAGPTDDAPPPVVAEAEPPPPPASQDGYQARRAEWQARLDTVMQGQRGPG